MRKIIIFISIFIICSLHIKAQYYYTKGHEYVIKLDSLSKNYQLYYTTNLDKTRPEGDLLPAYLLSKGFYMIERDVMKFRDQKNSFILKYSISNQSIVPIATFPLLAGTPFFASKYKFALELNEICNEGSHKESTPCFSKKINFSNKEYVSQRDIPDSAKKPLLHYDGPMKIIFKEKEYAVFLYNKVLSEGKYYVKNGNFILLVDRNFKCKFLLKCVGNVLVPINFFITDPYCIFKESERKNLDK